MFFEKLSLSNFFELRQVFLAVDFRLIALANTDSVCAVAYTVLGFYRTNPFDSAFGFIADWAHLNVLFLRGLVGEALFLSHNSLTP